MLIEEKTDGNPHGDQIAGERRWLGWQGLFRELEERLWRENAAVHWRGWGYVPNRVGGFLGFWWKPLDRRRNMPSICNWSGTNSVQG